MSTGQSNGMAASFDCTLHTCIFLCTRRTQVYRRIQEAQPWIHYYNKVLIFLFYCWCINDKQPGFYFFNWYSQISSPEVLMWSLVSNIGTCLTCPPHLQITADTVDCVDLIAPHTFCQSDNWPCSYKVFLSSDLPFICLFVRVRFTEERF